MATHADLGTAWRPSICRELNAAALAAPLSRDGRRDTWEWAGTPASMRAGSGRGVRAFAQDARVAGVQDMYLYPLAVPWNFEPVDWHLIDGFVAALTTAADRPVCGRCCTPTPPRSLDLVHTRGRTNAYNSHRPVSPRRPSASSLLRCSPVVLDLGSGYGKHAAVLQDAGLDVHGIEFSPAAVACGGGHRQDR